MVRPEFAIVIPAYRQPLLLNEAIASAAAGFPHFAVVVVNDGCPMPETARVCASWRSAYPDNVFVLHVQNGGLSAARNRGVRFALSHWPTVRGFFLLDADNRLASDAAGTFRHLLDSQPDYHWYYPHFDMFGQRKNVSHGGEYSMVLHGDANFCEAGSLIRREVFDGGVFFDENMRQGYEDWDFWLRCAGRGFRGYAADERFFAYRRRAESMLTSSHSADAVLRATIHKNHRWLFNVRSIIDLEEAEVPRYRIFLTDTGQILSLTDPMGDGRSMTSEEFDQEFWQTALRPQAHSCGAIWFFTDSVLYGHLKKLGLMRFVLWNLERRHEKAKVARLCIEPGPEGCFDYAEPDKSPVPYGPIDNPEILSVRTDTIIEWMIENLGNEPPFGRVPCAEFTLQIPLEPALEFDKESRFVALSSRLQSLNASPYSHTRKSKWDWRKREFWPRSNSHKIVRRVAQTGPIYPANRRRNGGRTICFFLHIASFGGVETVAANVARALRTAGFRTALCLGGNTRIALATDVLECFDEILWHLEPGYSTWDYADFSGTYLPKPLKEPAIKELVGLLGGFDAVIGCHPVAGISAFGQLRAMGVITVLHEHVMELTQFGFGRGHPMIAVAYEAAIDKMLTCSHGLKDWLFGHGVPEEKIMAIPNAAGFSGSSRTQSPARDIAGRNLRALFLGRLDYQKGLDRLEEIITGLASRGLQVDWRIVGKSVIGDWEEQTDIAGVAIEPPVYRDDEKSAIYDWADVLVLPSRFEGVPLTILEAQRHGVVCIASDVGQVAEAILHDQTGLLVSNDNCAAETIANMVELIGDAGRIKRISAEASLRSHTWDQSVEPLVKWLDEEIEKRNPGRA